MASKTEETPQKEEMLEKDGPNVQSYDEANPFAIMWLANPSCRAHRRP